jgi:hypothetical protein
MIAVMLLASIALGILGWNAMHPQQEETRKEETRKEEPVQPAKPQPNPEYVKLQEDLAEHERHCMRLGPRAQLTIQRL